MTPASPAFLCSILLLTSATPRLTSSPLFPCRSPPSLLPPKPHSSSASCGEPHTSPCYKMGSPRRPLARGSTAPAPCHHRCLDGRAARHGRTPWPALSHAKARSGCLAQKRSSPSRRQGQGQARPKGPSMVGSRARSGPVADLIFP
jgi:hypothetical protein